MQIDAILQTLNKVSACFLLFHLLCQEESAAGWKEETTAVTMCDRENIATIKSSSSL